MPREQVLSVHGVATLIPLEGGPSVFAISQHHPVVVRLNEERFADFQLRIADRITAFAGSMKFVYLHALLFLTWMVVLEQSPWPTLTLAVSLEAIFLSTFVMIGQNRQGTFQQAKADHDFLEEEQELKLNTELTRSIHDLTLELHQRLVGGQTGTQPEAMTPDGPPPA
jgi:uncharacterized membrane protein